MTYLLDTCVISDFIKGESGVIAKILSIAPREIYVSTISRMEVEYGLVLNPGRAKKLKPGLVAFFESVQLIPFTDEDALAAAHLRADLKKLGLPIGPYDILLAGSALQRGLIFVTSNLKEFKRIKNLQLEDWR